jgi:putative MATE family efflux protein
MTEVLGRLGTRALGARILALALPVVFANLTQTLMGLVDTLMVGKLGAAPLAGVGVATLLFSAVATPLKAVDVAVQSMTAYRVGARRDGEVGQVLATGGAVTLVLALLVTAAGRWDPQGWMRLISSAPDVQMLGADYLRWRVLGAVPFMLAFQMRSSFDGIGWTRVGMTVGIVMNVANAALNWVLIFGHLGAPAMGVAGAALASTIASLLACLVFTLLLLRPHVRRRFRYVARDNLHGDLLRPMLRMAWPAAVQSLGALLAVLVFFVILGRISTVAVAAGNVVFRIAALSFMPGFGMGAAVQTLVGQSLGRGDPQGARRTGWGGVILAVAFMGVFGLVFLLWPGALMRLFAADAALIAAGTPILRMMGLVQVFDAVGLTLAGALRGAGATRPVMLTDVLTAWCFFLPAAWFFGVHLDGGLTGAWIGVVLWFFLYAVGMVVWFLRGSWLRDAPSGRMV